jgi:hypothetical protein
MAVREAYNEMSLVIAYREVATVVSCARFSPKQPTKSKEIAPMNTHQDLELDARNTHHNLPANDAAVRCAASCPNCDGFCTHEPGHGSAHRCAKCGHQW